MRKQNGQFASGAPSGNHLPVGTIRVRCRHKRRGEKRAWIKIKEPNMWQLLARYKWETDRGGIPIGFSLHHKDGNSLNDCIDNLELVSKSEHLAIHRHSFQERAILSFIKTRRERRWSTKSKTKQTGAPPKYDLTIMNNAVNVYLLGNERYVDVGKKFNIDPRILAHWVKKKSKK